MSDWQSMTEQALQALAQSVRTPLPGPMEETQRLLSQALSACQELAQAHAATVLRERTLRNELDQLRQERGTAIREAHRLISYAFHLRQYGEEAPGGNESWTEFDRRAERFLRMGARPCPARWPSYTDQDHGGVIRHSDGSFCGHKDGHVPERGSDVEAWIKQARDEFDGLHPNSRDHGWYVLDALLDDYRHHADTGTPIDRKVSGPHPEGD